MSLTKTHKIIIGSATIILSVYIVLSFLKPKLKTKPKLKQMEVFLVGGLDNRGGDLSIFQQVGLVKKGFSSSKNVVGVRYSDYDSINQLIKSQTQSPYVLLFSAGCRWSSKIAGLFKEKNFDLNNIYIIEPYHSGGTTSKSVLKAVSMGVPNKNVFVGSSTSTGKGIVPNTSLTPNCNPKHWCSLTEVAKIINSI